MSTKFKRKQPGKMSDRFDPTPHLSLSGSPEMMFLLGLMLNSMQLLTTWHCSLGSADPRNYHHPPVWVLLCTPPWAIRYPHCVMPPNITSPGLFFLHASVSSLPFLYFLFVHSFPLTDGALALILIPVCHTNKRTLSYCEGFGMTGKSFIFGGAELSATLCEKTRCS